MRSQQDRRAVFGFSTLLDNLVRSFHEDQRTLDAHITYANQALVYNMEVMVGRTRALEAIATRLQLWHRGDPRALAPLQLPGNNNIFVFPSGTPEEDARTPTGLALSEVLQIPEVPNCV